MPSNPKPPTPTPPKPKPPPEPLPPNPPTIPVRVTWTIPAHLYEVRPRKDKRGADLISDVLPFFFPKLRSAISVEQVGLEAPACFPTTLKTFLQHSASLESFLKVKWQMMRLPKRSTIRPDVYEIRPRADKHGVDLVGDALPYSPMWYRGPKAITDAIDHATFYSRSHDAVIRVYDDVGNVIATHGACDLCAPQ